MWLNRCVLSGTSVSAISDPIAVACEGRRGRPADDVVPHRPDLGWARERRVGNDGLAADHGQVEHLVGLPARGGRGTCVLRLHASSLTRSSSLCPGCPSTPCAKPS
jgi:hypothetical protein